MSLTDSSSMAASSSIQSPRRTSQSRGRPGASMTAARIWSSACFFVSRSERRASILTSRTILLPCSTSRTSCSAAVLPCVRSTIFLAAARSLIFRSGTFASRATGGASAFLRIAGWFGPLGGHVVLQALPCLLRLAIAASPSTLPCSFLFFNLRPLLYHPQRDPGPLVVGQVAAAELVRQDPELRPVAVDEVESHDLVGYPLGLADVQAIVAVQQDVLGVPDDQRVAAPFELDARREPLNFVMAKGWDECLEFGINRRFDHDQLHFLDPGASVRPLLFQPPAPRTRRTPAPARPAVV